MKVKKILFVTLVLFVFVTLLAIFGSLGEAHGDNGGGVGKITTSATVTTSPPAEPEEPTLTPGEELAREITPWKDSSESYQTDSGFHLGAGASNAARISIEVEKKGIYSITFSVQSATQNGAYYSAYITPKYEEVSFVTEVFADSASTITMDVPLDEGKNDVHFFVTSYPMEITSVTYKKIADYDISITNFSASGAGANTEWSGNASLTFADVYDISNSVIRSGTFTVAEDGKYILTFIAGAKCEPNVSILSSAGNVVDTVTYSKRDWNSYGVVPNYNNASTVYIADPTLFAHMQTVELVAGEYTIEVAFGDDHLNGDTILVHSAYLRKK